MTNNNPSNAKALLEKFQAGHCTPEELAILDQWYATLEEDHPAQLSAQQTQQYKQQFLHTFRNRLQPPAIIRTSIPVIRWLAAACVLLLAGAGYRWLLHQQAQPVAAGNMQIVANTTSHVKKIALADSSIVWLNAHASLSWKQATTRQVTLEGEGYFEVHTNTQQPFTVNTRDMQIKVLGTAFNVEAYTAEKMTRVALVNGRVQLRAAADSNNHTLLQPGQIAVLTANQPWAITTANTDAVASWTNGGFVVNNISVKDAVARLCERNACTLEWKSIKDIQKIISVAFMRESFEQSLSNLCYLLHKQYKIQGNHVTIY
ncbi:FecR family protein [Filimonas lacunae]|uniref:FecR family protein n=1 Tax=Filimonas lacunae TaxID=477680 RepID=A0A173MPT0_9BACT|nr:FecR domain-containing protein [Filimonas lacunae]BAV09683.1 anti-sigma factor [Filimonas lacunae]SIS77195.1 FecR family protein [Filimonas lacunae]